ncbi:MAG: hypothetical protein NXH88_11065 [Hyphomonas sp.]|nr:hypothetical protein [Hyphomonas sp.]
MKYLMSFIAAFSLSISCAAQTTCLGINCAGPSTTPEFAQNYLNYADSLIAERLGYRSIDDVPNDRRACYAICHIEYYDRIEDCVGSRDDVVNGGLDTTIADEALTNCAAHAAGEHSRCLISRGYVRCDSDD